MCWWWRAVLSGCCVLRLSDCVGVRGVSTSERWPDLGLNASHHHHHYRDSAGETSAR